MTDRRSPPADPSAESSMSDKISDQEWANVIRSELGPGERTPAERAAFRMRLDERLENRGRVVWQRWAMTTGAAIAAGLLWFAMVGSQIESTDPPDELLADAGAPGLLSYAYYETDYMASGASGDAFLPDEYMAIESAFDVP